VIAGSLFVWSAATWATGHVTTFDQLIASRMLMGVSEACYIPAALALITDFHLGPTRSRAVGIHQSAIYCGIILGGFSGYVADNPALGWRRAFDVCGLVGILYAIPLFALLRNAPRSADAPPNPSPIAALRELLRKPSFILLVIYFTLPAIAGWVVKDWMPDILREKFGLGQGKAGVSAVLYVQIASLIGVALGGWWADRWSRRSLRGRIYVSAIGMSFFLPALFGVADSGTLLIAVGFLMLFGLGWGFFDCNNMPILCQLVRPELRATAFGIMNMVGTSFGGFADWGFGKLRDNHVPLNVIFGVFAATCSPIDDDRIADPPARGQRHLILRRGHPTDPKQGATMPTPTISPEVIQKLRTFDTPTICNLVELFDVRPRNTGYMDARIGACFPDMPPAVGFAGDRDVPLLRTAA
jgi:MFS family permease